MRTGGVTRSRGPRDDFERGDFGQARQDLVLDAFREVKVLLVAAQIFERKDGNRFGIDVSIVRQRGGMRQGICRNAARREDELVESKITKRQYEHGDDHSVHSSPGLRGDGLLGGDVLIAFQSLWRQLEDPAKDQCRNKSDHEHDHDAARQPVGRAEHREHRSRDLHEQPGADQIKSGHADNIAPLQLREKVTRFHLGFSSQSFWKRGSLRNGSHTGSSRSEALDKT